MSKHFSYLVRDESENFFQKVAFQEAGIAPSRPAPREMAKQASFASDFEKVASRLDRDLGILKSAGACGTSFGMCKRANAYIEVLLTNTDLSSDEFSQVFDKIAASAIEADLNASWQELSPECPEEYLPWLEGEFAKVGYMLASEAEMEKQAIVGILRAIGGGLAKTPQAISRTRAAAAGARAVVKTPGTVVKGGVGKLRGAAGEKSMATIKADLQAIKGRGVAQTAMRKNLAKQYAAARVGRVQGLTAQRSAARKLKVDSPMSEGNQQFMKKERARNVKLDASRARRAAPSPKQIEAPTPPGSPAGTTAPKNPAGQVDEVAAARANRQKIQQEQAAQDAAGAAKGTGTHGPAPSPSPSTNTKPVTAPQAEAAGAPRGVIEKLKGDKSGGWDSLTGAEKLQAGAGAYLGAKMVFND